MAEAVYVDGMKRIYEHGTNTVVHSKPSVRSTRGTSSLGLTATDTGQLIRQIEKGFPFKSLESFEENTGLGISMLAAIVGIPERTLARRKVAGKLAPEESERLLRIACIFEKAAELFEGEINATVKWLTTPRKTLDNQSPLAYSRTELGAREAEALIAGLEQGVFV